MRALKAEPLRQEECSSKLGRSVPNVLLSIGLRTVEGLALQFRAKEPRHPTTVHGDGFLVVSDAEQMSEIFGPEAQMNPTLVGR